MESIINKTTTRIKQEYRTSFRHQILIKLSFYGSIFYALFSIIYFLIGFQEGFVFMTFGLLSQILLIQLFIQKKLNYFITFKIGLIITCVTLFLNILYSGGIFSQTMPWFLVVPVLANLILENKRANIIWLVVTILGILTLIFLDYNNIEIQTRIDDTDYLLTCACSFSGFTFMLLFLTSLFEKKKNHFYRELLIKEIQIQENIELKNTRVSLKETEERWKFAIEGSNDGIWDYNYETGEVYRSTRWAEMLGFKKEEISNSIEEWKMRIHPEDLHKVNEKLKQHFNKEIESYSSEHRMLCKNGSYIWVLDRGKVIAWTEKGKPQRVVGTKTDITKRKNAEEELKQSEGKLQAIFEGSNDAILLLTEKGFFDCNQKALEMFNVNSKESIKSIHPADISPEFQPDGRNSLEKADEMIKIAFEKGINRFEWEHKRLCGAPFSAEVLLSSFYYDNKLVLQSTVQDITERKTANEKIKLSEEKYRSLVENSPDIIMITGIDEKIEFLNSTLKNDELDGILGTSLYNYVEAALYPVIENAHLKVLSGQGNQIYETERLDQDGNVQFLQTHVGPRYVEDKIAGLVLFIQNITLRKLSEEKIKQSEEKYRSLVENSPEIIIIVDSKEKIEFLNSASHRYDQQKIIGDDLYNYVHERHHNEIKIANKRVLAGEVKYESYETQGTDVNGKTQHFQTHVGPKYLDDKVIGLVLFIRNITDRKTSEVKIKQSLAEKVVLLKEVHHRVKNNLQIISSILNLQSSTISDQNTLELLRNSQDRIRSMSLIHELLYQTKDFSTIKFSEYIQSISTNLFHSYNQNKNTTLDLDLDDIYLDLDMAIPCGLIVNELVTNSLKYAFDREDNGIIRIQLKKINNRVKLSISDNGVGFPQEIDFRNTLSLGMQLVVSLIDQIDGDIVLMNEKGTRYEITFDAPEEPKVIDSANI